MKPPTSCLMTHPGQSGTLGAGEYERVTPARFAADSDDIFMRSMIQNYAIDKNCAGPDDPPKPCGKFTMNEVTMRALPQRSSAPIRDSAVEPSKSTSTPTSPRPGDISMSTRPEKSKSSSHHNS